MFSCPLGRTPLSREGAPGRDREGTEDEEKGGRGRRVVERRGAEGGKRRWVGEGNAGNGGRNCGVLPLFNAFRSAWVLVSISRPLRTVLDLASRSLVKVLALISRHSPRVSVLVSRLFEGLSNKTELDTMRRTNQISAEIWYRSVHGARRSLVIGRLNNNKKSINYNKQKQNMVFTSLLNATAATINSYLAGCRLQLALTQRNVVSICFHFVVLLTFS
jgi:hypothetical protein